MPVCVVPEPGACSASHELPSRCDAPDTCTVHMVMHSQLRWRARAHGADGRRALRRLGGSSSFLPFASARSDGVVRAPVSAACVSALRTPLGTLTTRWSPRACAANDAGAANMCDGREFPPFGRKKHSLLLLCYSLLSCVASYLTTACSEAYFFCKVIETSKKVILIRQAIYIVRAPS